MQFRNRTRQQRRNRDGWGLSTDDPYQPSSPGYAERAREQEVEIVGFHPGTVRIDLGGTVALAHVARPAVPPAAPAPAPTARKPEPKAPDLKPGIGKRHRRPD